MHVSNVLYMQVSMTIGPKKLVLSLLIGPISQKKEKNESGNMVCSDCQMFSDIVLLTTVPDIHQYCLPM